MMVSISKPAGFAKDLLLTKAAPRRPHSLFLLLNDIGTTMNTLAEHIKLFLKQNDMLALDILVGSKAFAELDSFLSLLLPAEVSITDIEVTLAQLQYYERELLRLARSLMPASPES